MEDFGYLVLTRRQGEWIEIKTPHGLLTVMTGVINRPAVRLILDAPWLDNPESIKFIEGQAKLIETQSHTIELGAGIIKRDQARVTMEVPKSWNIKRGELP